METMNRIPIKDAGFDHMWEQFERKPHTERYIQAKKFKQLTKSKDEEAFKKQGKNKKPFVRNIDFVEHWEQ